MNNITELLTFAVNNGAEQVLVSAGSPPAMRRQGKLFFAKMDALTPENTRNLIASALTPVQMQQFDQERELHFSLQVMDNTRVLGSAYYERGCVSGVFRIVPSAMPPAKLGLPSMLADATGAAQGLIIIAAPPGHGKSTALASLVELINAGREATILTIEACIRCPHVNKKSVVHQREVGRDTLSFSSALDAASAQDPDVVVIDPMKNAETVRRALGLAGRGRLVLASMEADYVLETLTKLMDAAEDRTSPGVRRQLAASLLLVAALRLLPRRDSAGRVPATELLKVDARVAGLIRSGDLKSIEKCMASPEETGSWTMDSFILKLHERGLVDDEAARRHLLDVSALES
ncbi:MAG TPA: ATPase, T2SS/T4P/T4SS family [Planctomycetota bacterium]|nr:ATPase, T2SS/T4P/T4SS family [Planctomycetota bacterium]